ncbi:MAG TPA: hypothetical protein VHL53_13830 [Acidimicrobiia bacterium]|nr:hypothetical protein [Acidimicrobiia bacterium]
MTADEARAAARAVREATAPAGPGAEGPAAARLAEASAALLEGVRAALPAWAERVTAHLLDAWTSRAADRPEAPAEAGPVAGAAGEAAVAGAGPAGAPGARRRSDVLAEARAAGEAAAERVAADLAALLALDPAEQRATPLQIIRTAVAEPTAVLAAAGLPDVVRDPFDEQAWPDDRFGLVPRTLQDLDPDLAAVHFAWGVAKAAVLRARAAS